MITRGSRGPAGREALKESKTRTPENHAYSQKMINNLRVGVLAPGASLNGRNLLLTEPQI